MMILTQHKKKDKKRIANLKLKWARFEIVDVTNLDYHILMDIIFWNEQFGSPTNLILNSENSDLASTDKRNQLFEDLCQGHKVLHPFSENFKFVELAEAWLSTLNGAYLMSSVQISGGAWKDKVEYLCKSNVIGRGKVYNILVLSGTHGSKNTASGFSDNTKLDKSLYNADKQTAQWLEKNMAKEGFKICITVANMRDFSKPLGPKLDLCEFVEEENPNMVVMAWCYSTNGNSV